MFTFRSKASRARFRLLSRMRRLFSMKSMTAAASTAARLMARWRQKFTRAVTTA